MILGDAPYSPLPGGDVPTLFYPLGRVNQVLYLLRKQRFSEWSPVQLQTV